MYKYDLSNKVFGRWTVISYSHNAPNRKGAVWVCKCICGASKLVRASILLSGESKSCGCLQRDVSRSNQPSNFIDMVGETFGRLTVIERDTKSGKHTKWVCKCSCGTIVSVIRCNLVRGRQISCGCKNREAASLSHTSHGLSQTKLYRVWSGMITRCYNENTRHYRHYGGRGISMSDEWRSDYMNFHKDMASGYRKGLEIDRIDVNGNYCKENCRWVTPKENARNKRNTVYVVHNGIKKPLTQWAEEKGIENTGKMHDRVKKGWKFEYIMYGKTRFDPNKMILK